jgi:hypothetical protein
VAAGVLVALAVGIAGLVDMRNEVASLRTELASSKAQYNELKAKNERIFSLLVALVKDGALTLETLKPFVTPSEASEISAKAAKSQKEQLPFALDSKFYPSGWMGDGEFGQEFIQLRRRPATIEGQETTAISIIYRKGPKGWAGIYWQYPDGNWGDKPGRNLLGARAITFLAKGARGGEIVEFKSGGIRGQYRDSYEVSLDKVVLKKDWTRYSIDLSKSDLSSVIGAFAWTITASDNESGNITTYLANLRVE